MPKPAPKPLKCPITINERENLFGFDIEKGFFANLAKASAFMDWMADNGVDFKQHYINGGAAITDKIFGRHFHPDDLRDDTVQQLTMQWRDEQNEWRREHGKPER